MVLERRECLSRNGKIFARDRADESSSEPRQILCGRYGLQSHWLAEQVLRKLGRA